MIRDESPMKEWDDVERDPGRTSLGLSSSTATMALTPFDGWYRRGITPPTMAIHASIGAGQSAPAEHALTGGER